MPYSIPPTTQLKDSAAADHSDKQHTERQDLPSPQPGQRQGLPAADPSGVDSDEDSRQRKLLLIRQEIRICHDRERIALQETQLYEDALRGLEARVSEQKQKLLDEIEALSKQLQVTKVQQSA